MKLAFQAVLAGLVLNTTGILLSEGAKHDTYLRHAQHRGRKATESDFEFFVSDIRQDTKWCLTATETDREFGNLGFRKCDMNSRPTNQLWKLEANGLLRSAVDNEDKCAVAGFGHELFEGIRIRLGLCDLETPYNKFTWNVDNTYYLQTMEEGYCVTNRGPNPHSSDTIHALECMDRGDFQWNVDSTDGDTTTPTPVPPTNKPPTTTPPTNKPPTPAPTPSNDDTPPEEQTVFTPFPGDGRRILKAKLADGIEILYLGSKDDNGNVDSFDEFLVTTPELKTKLGNLDSEGRPVRLFGLDGTQIDIEWITDTMILLTYITGDGENQLIAEVNLSEILEEACSRRRVLEKQQPADALSHQEIHPRHRTLQDTSSGTTTIELLRCNDQPVTDAVAIMCVTRSGVDGMSIEEKYPAVHTSNGVYLVTFDINLPPLTDNFVESAAQALNDGCSAQAFPACAVPSLCELIAAELPNADLLDVCQELFLASEFVCDNVGTVEEISNNIQESPTFAVEQLEFLPLVLSEDISFEPQTAPETGPYPTFRGNIGDEPSVVSFTIDPEDPDPFEDYLAVAQVTCAETVFLSIVGTDNYTDDTTCNFFDTASIQECVLSVPGSFELVRDDITLSVNGGEIVREVSIVF